MQVLFYKRTRYSNNPIRLKQFLIIGFYDIEATELEGNLSQQDIKNADFINRRFYRTLRNKFKVIYNS